MQTNSWQNNSLNNSSIVSGFSEVAEEVESEFEDILKHYYDPYSRQPLMQKFCNLAVTWIEETSLLSSISQISMHPAYQEIIGMGSVVIPWIFIALQYEQNHWFWALKALTGVDPVPKMYKGNISRMTEIWLEWGKTNGYTR